MDSNDVENIITRYTYSWILSSVPFIVEIKRAVKQLTNGKSSSNDGILTEIYKFGSNLLVHNFMISFLLSGIQNHFIGSLKILLLSIYTSTNAKNAKVTTIWVSPFRVLLEKFMDAPFWTDSTLLWLSQSFSYLSAAFRLVETMWTLFSV